MLKIRDIVSAVEKKRIYIQASGHRLKRKNTQFVASPDYVKTPACFDVSKRFKSKETKDKNIAFFSFLQTGCLIKDLTMTRA
ncbi:MAG: hypothetical protein ABFD15_07645 [Methanofastidiosum sp.]